MALLGLMSCQQEPFDENRALEDYTRAFIKQFGLISPDQDWSDAKQTSVSVDLGSSSAKEIKVLCEISGKTFLLAQASNLAGSFKIDFDMPESVYELIVLVDGRRYYALPDGKVSVSSSRAEDSDEDTAEDFEPVKWLLIAEDLGTIGDFDFNDFIAQIAISPAKTIEFDPYYKDYEEVEGGSAVLSRGSGEAQTLSIKALAAGGTMKLFLHYRTYNGDDFIIGPGNAEGYVLTSDIGSEAQADKFEWHKWFSDGGAYGYAHTTMINTVVGQRKAAGTQIVLPFRPSNASRDGVIDTDYTMENYCIFNKKGEGRFGIGRGFYLTVNDYKADESNSGDIVFGQVIGRTNRGDAPQMFSICDIGEDGGPWPWPVERRNISAVYPLFKRWSATNDSRIPWYQSPVGSANVDYYVR